MKFCTECGHKLEPGQPFCSECGNKYEENSQNAQQTDYVSQHMPAKQKKPLSKRSKIILMVASLFLIGLFSTHKIISAQYDPMKMITEIDRAIADQDAELFFSHVHTDKNAQLNEKEFLEYVNRAGWNIFREGIVQAVKSNTDDVISNTFFDGRENKLFTLTKEPRIFGLYEEYIINAIPSTVYLESNMPAVETELGGQQLSLADPHSPIEAGLFYPGVYPLKASTENDFGQFDLSIDADLAEARENKKNIRIDFPTNTYGVNSNVEGAILYINGTSTGKTLESYSALGPFPADKPVEMYAVWKSSDGTDLKSNILTQDDAGWSGFFFRFDDGAVEKANFAALQEIQANRDLLREDEIKAEDTVLEFRAAYENALNNRDYDLIKPFLQAGSPVEQELKKYIGDLKEEDFSYDFLETSVLQTVQLDSGTFQVTTSEKFIFTNHLGTKTDYSRVKLYTVFKEDNVFRINEIEINNTVRNSM